MRTMPDDQLLAALFRARSRAKGKDLDLNRIAELLSGALPESAEAWQEISALEPELCEALMTLKKELSPETAAAAEREESEEDILKVLAGARWRGALRIGYTKEGLFRVGDPGDALRFPRWVDTVFRVGKRMIGSEEVGIWPTEEVTFAWPGEEPILQASVAVREEAPVLTVRRSLSGQAKETAEEVEVEYWRGGQWIGAATLWAEEPQLVIHLKPEWPYILAVRGDEAPGRTPPDGR